MQLRKCLFTFCIIIGSLCSPSQAAQTKDETSQAQWAIPLISRLGSVVFANIAGGIVSWLQNARFQQIATHNTQNSKPAKATKSSQGQNAVPSSLLESLAQYHNDWSTTAIAANSGATVVAFGTSLLALFDHPQAAILGLSACIFLSTTAFVLSGTSEAMLLLSSPHLSFSLFQVFALSGAPILNFASLLVTTHLFAILQNAYANR